MDILETNPDSKYFLSEKVISRLLSYKDNKLIPLKRQQQQQTSNQQQITNQQQINNQQQTPSPQEQEHQKALEPILLRINSMKKPKEIHKAAE